MTQVEETPTGINSKDLAAFAHALRSGDFSARLPRATPTITIPKPPPISTPSPEPWNSWSRK